MSLIKFLIRPGIVKDVTDYSNEGGWVDGDKVRFVSGLPQKIGGWVKFTRAPFLGVCRYIYRWVTSSDELLTALGTHLKLYIHYRGNLYDITPVRDSRSSTDTDNAITAVSGSSTISVSLTTHGALIGDRFRISGVVGAGSPEALFGIPVDELNAEHEVTAVADADTFSFEVPTAATGSGMGGGTAIEMEFDLSAGLAESTVGRGWGSSPWGHSEWGAGGDLGVALDLRYWWLTNFDDDLIANIANGGIYYWERTSNPFATASGARAIELHTTGGSDVPRRAAQVMVSPTYRHLLAFGCTPFGTDAGADPLLIRWASQDSINDWTPRQTNSAGFLRVSSGRRIMRAASTRQEILIWTESSLSSLQYLGTADVFGLHNYASNLTLMSPRAVVVSRDVVFWMGKGQFYTYEGRVVDLPCPLQEYVFNDINLSQSLQVFGTTNERFHEIWWFYPSGGSTTVDRYVMFNYMEEVWAHGELDRTAWVDAEESDHPQATGYTGLIYDHEVGSDADGVAMPSFIKSSDLALDTGDEFMLTHRIIPDVSFRGSTTTTPEVELSVYPRNFPGGAPHPDPHDNAKVISTAVGRYTEQVFIRARARHMAMRIASDNLGTHWQLGVPRVDVRKSGKR